MTTSQVVFIGLALIVVVVLDVLLFRWWRQFSLANSPSQLLQPVAVRLAQARRWVADRLPRPAPAPAAPLLMASAASEPSADLPAAPPPASPAASAEPLPAAPVLVEPLPPAAPPAELPVAPPPPLVAPEPAPAPPAVVSTVLSPVQVTQINSAGPEQWARVNLSVEMPVGATMRVTIETTPNNAPVVTLAQTDRAAAPPAALAALAAAPAAAAPPRAPWRRPGWLTRPALRLPASTWGPRVRAIAAAPARSLFVVALLLYLVTRLIGLDRYPIYFFTDESVHTVLANEFVNRGLRNSAGELLPTYFPLGPSYNLNGVSVYIQVLPYLLFGKSVAVTRGASALITLLAAIAVGLILRDVFRARYWWAATLLLSIAPAWFLHSRTAFEYAEVSAYFAAFLYCYLRYRQDRPNFIYGAVIFGALAFYTHGLGVVLMGVTSVLLVVSDYRYHWQQRAVVGRALLLTLLLALPYVRYSAVHPSAFVDQLQQRGSMWTDPTLALPVKLQRYLAEYAYGLSPAFWFLPNNGRDLARHLMDHYGNLWWFTLPLFVIGLVLTLWRVREPRYRAVLLALLATPVGSALVAIGIPRMLWFIMPAVVCMALGLEWCLAWVQARWPAWRNSTLALSLAVFVALAGVNVYMFGDALVNGGRWSQDYTLYGMQWGAQQLFGEAIPARLAADPDVQIYVSPSWANGADMFISFFLTSAQTTRVSFNGLDYYLAERRTLPADYDLVITPDEYARLTADPKIAAVKVNQIVNYPNGEPGFYFVQYEYSAYADELFNAADVAYFTPITEPFTLDGDTVTITHPHFGSGSLPDLLDDNTFTLINAPRVNPLVLDFAFPRPWSLTGLNLTTGSMDDFSVTVEVFSVGSDQPVTLTERYQGLPADPTVTFSFGDAPVSVDRVRVSVADSRQGDGVNIHLRELQFIHAP